MAHYKQTEAKEADFSRRMNKRMAQEKEDEAAVCNMSICLYILDDVSVYTRYVYVYPHSMRKRMAEETHI
jgi:hypothetical protein